MPKIIYEKDGRIGRITLNRPEVMNAIDDDVPRELAEAVARREPAKSTDPFDPDNYLGSFQRLMGGEASSGGGHLLGGLAGE